MNLDKMSANERFEATLNFAINNRKADLVSLLQANGVLVDNQTPDEQLYLATARAIKFSPTFKRAFTYYMTDAIQSGSFLNFVGLNPSEQAILGMDFTGEVNSDGMDAFYSADGQPFYPTPTGGLPSFFPTPTGAPIPTGGGSGTRFGDKLRNADADTINKWLNVGFNVANKIGTFRGGNTGDNVPTGMGGGANEPTPSWWKTQSPMAKAGIIGGGIVLVGGIILLTRKK
jgi:hypothetical protein